MLHGETADRRRFAAEARLLATLDHPNLVHLYDAIDGDDLAVLVMEFVDGPPLTKLLDGRPLPPDRVARLGSEVAGCLAYLHARGVVHRDVKPANILLGSDGVARLADLGIARLVDATRLTATGTSMGTPTYMAPEQLAGAAVGPAADVYALGLVLLEARTGRRAFAGVGHEAVAARLARSPDIPVAELGREWVRLLSAMTARDPDHRPAAATVATALAPGSTFATAVALDPTIALGPTAAIRGASAATSPATPRLGTRALDPADRGAERRARRRGPLAAVALLAVLAVGLAAMVVARGGTRTPRRPAAPTTTAPATTSPPTTTAPATTPLRSTPAGPARAGAPGGGHAHHHPHD